MHYMHLPLYLVGRKTLPDCFTIGPKSGQYGYTGHRSTSPEIAQALMSNLALRQTIFNYGKLLEKNCWNFPLYTIWKVSKEYQPFHLPHLSKIIMCLCVWITWIFSIIKANQSQQAHSASTCYSCSQYQITSVIIYQSLNPNPLFNSFPHHIEGGQRHVSVHFQFLF